MERFPRGFTPRIIASLTLNSATLLRRPSGQVCHGAADKLGPSRLLGRAAAHVEGPPRPPCAASGSVFTSKAPTSLSAKTLLPRAAFQPDLGDALHVRSRPLALRRPVPSVLLTESPSQHARSSLPEPGHSFLAIDPSPAAVGHVRALSMAPATHRGEPGHPLFTPRL